MRPGRNRCRRRSTYQRTGTGQERQRFVVAGRADAETERARAAAAVPVVRHVGHTRRARRRDAVAAFPFPRQTARRRPDGERVRGDRWSRGQRAGRAN